MIVLFGGHPNASYNMYALDEEGELLEDFFLVPGAMCMGSFAV